MICINIQITWIRTDIQITLKSNQLLLILNLSSGNPGHKMDRENNTNNTNTEGSLASVEVCIKLRRNVTHSYVNTEYFNKVFQRSLYTARCLVDNEQHAVQHSILEVTDHRLQLLTHNQQPLLIFKY